MPQFEFENHVIEAEDGETVLSALLRAGHNIENRCRAGACQACLMKSVGDVPSKAQAGLDETLAEAGVFLSCQAKAEEVSQVARVDEGIIPTYSATLIEKRKLSGDVLLVRLLAPGFSGRPGRFIQLKHPSGIVRPYSLASPAWSDPELIELHVRLIDGGEMSGLLNSVEPGEAFEVVGPLGKCCYKGDSEGPILLIGSGTGLAPLFGIVTDAINKGHVGPIWLYHGAASNDGLYFEDELRELAEKAHNLNVVRCADNGAVGDVLEGSPLDAAVKDHKQMEGFRVYLCGHLGLVRAAQKKCFIWGASLRDIFADAFEAS